MDILHLLENKDFEALTPQETSFVLEQMSAEEYKEQRMVIVITQETFAEDDNNNTLVVPVPSKALKALQEKKKGGILVLFQSKVTLWKAAAVFLALLGGYHFLMKNSVQQPETVYLTEYVEKEVLVPANPDTVFKEVVVEVQPEKLATIEKSPRLSDATRINSEKREIYNFEQVAVLNSLETEFLQMNKKEGVSVLEDSLTRKILGI